MTNKEELRKTRSFEINELTPALKVSLRTRIISAIVAIAIVLPLVFLGDFFFAVLIGAALFLANFEIVRCAKGNYSIVLYTFALVFAAFIAFWPMVANIQDWSHWRVFSGTAHQEYSVTPYKNVKYRHNRRAVENAFVAEQRFLKRQRHKAAVAENHRKPQNSLALYGFIVYSKNT